MSSEPVFSKDVRFPLIILISN
uniref:Uncharacterized protein n=1 Tax=Anguilla anguilla TaxID=7936 RepID=A0A0E9QS65_ANGAN